MDLRLQQKEVADGTGVHPDTEKNWENGEHQPNAGHRERLGELLTLNSVTTRGEQTVGTTFGS